MELISDEMIGKNPVFSKKVVSKISMCSANGASLSSCFVLVHTFCLTSWLPLLWKSSISSSGPFLLWRVYHTVQEYEGEKA